MAFHVYDIIVNGKLFYVGVTSNPRRRFKSHKSVGTAPKTSTIKVVQSFEDVRAALDAERSRIESLNPPGNVRYLAKGRSRKQMSESVREMNAAAEEARLAERAAEFAAMDHYLNNTPEGRAELARATEMIEQKRKR